MLNLLVSVFRKVQKVGYCEDSDKALSTKTNVKFLEHVSVTGHWMHRLISRWVDGFIATEKVD
jgi:hypothetical protein